MGKTLTAYFTREQRQFLDILRQSYPQVLSTFYLTGGTALAACYFNHRLSEDIDLFTPALFDQNTIIEAMNGITKAMHARSSYVRIHESLQYILTLPKQKKLKVDFVPYHFKQLEPTIELDGIHVDSIEDIAVNKLLAISQRTASKDYVDLYFLLKKFTLWDLRIGEEHKFGMEMEPLYITSLLKNVDQLTTMPIMKKKLTIDQLKKFFLKEAKTLAAPMMKP